MAKKKIETPRDTLTRLGIRPDQCVISYYRKGTTCPKRGLVKYDGLCAQHAKEEADK